MSLPTLTEFRQSDLRSLEVCPRRLLKAYEVGDLITGWTGESTTLGTLFHEFVFVYMQTLKRPEVRPAKRMPSEEAINVAREVYNRSPWSLDSDHFGALMGMAARFATDPKFEWDVNRILFQEDALRVELVCPDGEVRTLKGAPDLVYSDPPYGAIVYDWKTGLGQPRSPKKREEDGEVVEGKQYLSDVGKFQREVYGLLVLKTLPAVRYVIMYEVPMRFASHGPRVARLDRSQLEHIEPRVAANMMKLDNGLREGPTSEVWEPKAGTQCDHCEAERGCPIPPGMRGAGAIRTQVEADIEARRFVRGRAMYKQASERLKAHEEAGLPPGRVNGREVVRWGPEPDAWRTRGGGRKFDVFQEIETSSEDVAA